jgi:hypothetical protein
MQSITPIMESIIHHNSIGTCAQAQGAMTLGAVDFVSKLVLYIVHERMWAFITFVL